MRRLSLLISQYAAPTEAQVRVTPSHGEDRPLGERAILVLPAGRARRLEPPALRAPRPPQPRLPRHRLGGSPRALDPLAGSIAGHSFFRVEGHLGRPVAKSKPSCKS
jgi:hypothetical protein